MIRKAMLADAARINEILYQVDDIHHQIRPDIFKGGEKKYTDEELESLITGDEVQIFVYEEDVTASDAASEQVSTREVLGYTICFLEIQEESHHIHARKSLYIDDFCVHEKARGKHVGEQLYAFVREYAKEQGCDSVTLNVWAGNDGAEKFYEHIGMHPLKTYMEDILK